MNKINRVSCCYWMKHFVYKELMNRTLGAAWRGRDWICFFVSFRRLMMVVWSRSIRLLFCRAAPGVFVYESSFNKWINLQSILVRQPCVFIPMICLQYCNPKWLWNLLSRCIESKQTTFIFYSSGKILTF